MPSFRHAICVFVVICMDISNGTYSSFTATLMYQVIFYTSVCVQIYGIVYRVYTSKNDNKNLFSLCGGHYVV